MNRVAKSVEGSRRARRAMVTTESACRQSHRRAVSDGFDAENADTSGTSHRRYRPCRSLLPQTALFKDRWFFDEILLSPINEAEFSYASGPRQYEL